MSNCLRSPWIHQGSLFYLLVLVLHIFNIVFHRISRVPLSPCVKHEVNVFVDMFEGYIIHLCGKIPIVVCICVYLQRLHLQLERRAEYVYISAIVSFLHALFHNDCLLFFLLFIVTNNILFRTNLCQCKERNLKVTSVMDVLTLPGINTVHFIYEFGFEILCFPCNSVLLCDSLEFMLWRGKQEVIC